MGRPPADRDALADVGGDLLHRSGVRATSLEAVAAEAGVTKVTLYRHFGSKDALLVQALERHHARRQAGLERTLSETADDWRSAVLGVFDWLAEWVDRPDFRGCAFIQAYVEVGAGLPEVRDLALRHKRTFAATLRERLESAAIEGAEEVAARLQLLVEGATALALLDGDVAHVQRARSAAADLLDGVEARR
jgi:AcrR family transcriptional regulator